MLQCKKDNSKQLPENLQRSQIELPALLGALDNLSTYVYTKDLEGRYTYANQLACQLLDRALHEVIGKTDPELFSPERCNEAIATDQRVLATGATVALDETLARPNQRPRTFWSVKAPLRDEQGRIIGLIGISTDITERKRTEQRAKAEQQRLAQRVEERTEQLAAEVERHALTSDQLRLAIDGAELGVWEYHLQPERFFWSKRCKRHLGLPAGEQPSYAGFMARIHPEDRTRVQRLIEHSLQTRQDYAAEYRLRWVDGSEHSISALGRVYCDAAGEPTHLAGVTQDITRANRPSNACSNARMLLGVSSPRFRAITIPRRLDWRCWIPSCAIGASMSAWPAPTGIRWPPISGAACGRWCRIWPQPSSQG